VELSVMQPAKRDGELVADFAAERADLSKAKVVGIARPAPTN